MDNLQRLIWILVGGILAVLVLVLIITSLTRARLRRKAKLDETLRQQLEALLLDVIKESSPDQGTIVDIRKFWQNRGVKPYQRNAVIEPLISAGHVKKPRPEQLNAALDRSSNGFGEFLRDLYNYAFYRPATHLQLTDRTWQRMVLNGISGTNIVIEKGGSMFNQKVSGKGNVVAQAGIDAASTKAAGDVIETKAGEDAHVQAGHSRSKDKIAGMSAKDLASLVEALRQDAPALHGVDRKKARELANKLERELDEDEPDADAVEDSVGRAGRFVERTSGLMKATAKLLIACGLINGD